MIAHDAYDRETPGAHWLALNPAVGEALGWHPISGGWFRWADGQGVPMVESVWWSDGSIHQFNHYLHTEVGDGCLVLVTEQGFLKLREWAGPMSRGGVVRRRKGWYGTDGEGQAIKTLTM